MHAQREGLLGQPPRAGEAVHDASHGAAALLAENRQRVVLGLARVNDDGQVDLARQTNLQPEDGLLDVPRGEVVVVVEADLAERPRLRRRAIAPRTSDATSDSRPSNRPA